MNLFRSLVDPSGKDSTSSFTYIDVKIEAILPRVGYWGSVLNYCSLLGVALQINFESQGDYHNQRDRPKSLSLQVTRATVTNVRSLEQSSRADLGNNLYNLKCH